MCAIHLPFLFIGKAPHESTKYSIYITTENVLVSYDSYFFQKYYNVFFTTNFFISNTYLNNLGRNFCFQKSIT